MNIQLTRGLWAEIDDADFDIVRGLRWTAHITRGKQYAIAKFSVNGERKGVLMHRLILGLNDRTILVDHIDGNGLNNRRENIRICTHAENMRNSKTRKHSKVGKRCIRYEKTQTGAYRYRAVVTFNGKRYRKWFNDENKALAWADEIRKELHGVFAYRG